MWMGIIFTMETLDGTPRSDWTSAVIKLGLALTAGIMLAELGFQVIRRLRAGSKSEGTPAND